MVKTHSSVSQRRAQRIVRLRRYIALRKPAPERETQASLTQDEIDAIERDLCLFDYDTQFSAGEPAH
jgi:hypothetical protein